MTKGDLIKQERTRRKITQKKLVKKCKEIDPESKISETTIGKYENNIRNPKHETLELIAAGLGCSVRDLIPVVVKDDGLYFDNKEDSDAYHISLLNDAVQYGAQKIRADEQYIEKLRVPALKLNETGRKVLLDNAEALAANEEMTKKQNGNEENKG